LTDSGRKWSPFTVGNKFYIKPAPCDERKEMINISLGGGRAFGSGEHETTRHCLELMETNSFSPHQRVLDYGTGTGILALAAAKLGAGFVLALDINFEAVLACQNNIRLNHIQQKIFVTCCDLNGIKSRFQFDCILANIYPEVIIARSEALTNQLKKDGFILLSGIEWDYIDDVKRCFSGFNYQIVNQKIGKDYNSILYRKVIDE
jgi:ribosomal protein L11 methyltransferase